MREGEGGGEGGEGEGGRERRKMFISLEFSLEFSLAFKIDVKLKLFIIPHDSIEHIQNLPPQCKASTAHTKRPQVNILYTYIMCHTYTCT